jgi:hypothetical protein
LLWLLLIILFVSLWQFLGPRPRSGPTVELADPATVATWLPTVLLAAAVFASVFAYRRLVLAAHAHNAAIIAANGHIAAGRFDEAARAVEGLAKSHLPQFRLMFHVERAVIAMARGERDEALAELGQVEPRGRFFRAAQRQAVLQARSVRAFLRASAGDAAGAREDIHALRAEPNAEPLLLARASLAEARLLDEAGDRASLGALLERDRWLLLHATAPRERALVRAYEAMLEATAASVYRQKADRGAMDEESAAIAAWVARFAPNAGPFVRGGMLPAGRAGDARAEVPSAEARRKVLATKPQRVKRRMTVSSGILMAWLGIVLGMGLVYTSMHEMLPYLGVTLVGMGIVGLLAWLLRGFRRRTRDAKRINAALHDLGVGALPKDALELEAKTPVHRAQAAHVLAEAALRRGDPAQALAECERGFLALGEAQGGKLAAPAAPAGGALPPWDLARILAAQRAFALAALGRADEAWAEVEWANGFPNTHTVFRVRVLSCLRARDYEGAARAVEARDASVALPARDEALAEMACFVGRPAARTAESASRLRAELRRDASLGAWVDAMAPKLLRAFERAAAELDAGTAGARAP